MTSRPRRIIDLHTHMFNVRYLPLKGILHSWGVPLLLAAPLTVIFNSIAGRSKLDSRDAISLENLSRYPSNEDELISEIYDLVEYSVYQDIEAVEFLSTVDALEQNDIYNALEELAEQHSSELGSQFDNDAVLHSFSTIKLDVSTIDSEVKSRESFSAIMNPAYRLALTWALKKLAVIAEAEVPMFHKAMSALTFVSTLLRSERSIYRTLLSEYGERKVSLYMHLMMDMEKSYKNSSPYYDFEEQQLDRMSTLVSKSNGVLIGFSAYHPKRRNHIDIIKKGIEKGNVGVKFYPPMGYLASGNEPKIQSMVDDFFDFCMGNDIPVFTHCTPVGFEAKKGFGLYSDPVYWRKALEKFPKLRVCFGHAGGGKVKVCDTQFYGWFSNEDQWNSDDNYSRKVIELCQDYENVYCELAYLHEIMNDSTEKDLLLARLVDVFTNDKGKYPISDKISYGSDWHMIDMIGESNNYLESLIKIFQHPSLIEHIDKFFYKNALSYLDLDSYLQRVERVNPNYFTFRSRNYLKSLADELV